MKRFGRSRRGVKTGGGDRICDGRRKKTKIEDQYQWQPHPGTKESHDVI